MSGRKKERKKERQRQRERERERDRGRDRERGGEAFIESDKLQINKLGPGRFRHGKCKRDRK